MHCPFFPCFALLLPSFQPAANWMFSVQPPTENGHTDSLTALIQTSLIFRGRPPLTLTAVEMKKKKKQLKIARDENSHLCT